MGDELNRRLADLLMRLYPRWFRRSWGSELESFLASEHENARVSAKRGWRTRFWAGALRDALAASVRLRLGGASDRLSRDGRWSRATGRSSMSSELVRDLRFSLRGLIRAPGYHVLAILTVALGVAATTSVFSVLDSVLLRPLSYPASDRLVLVGNLIRGSGSEIGPLSHPDVLAFAERSRLLEAIAAVEVRRRVLRPGDAPVQGVAGAVSDGFLEMLGARPGLGRLLTAADHEPGSAAVAVLSQGLWRTRYGGDPSAIGQTLEVDGASHLVVGVLEAGFIPPEDLTGVQVWTALALDPAARGSFAATGLGRLRPGATVEALTVELQGITTERYAQGGASFVEGSRAVGLRDATIGDVGGTLWLLLGAVGLLLAIACTNVANLMLARGSDRAVEVAVRAAIGASRWRLVRQLLTESAFMGIAGGALGALATFGVVRAVRALDPGGIPRLTEVSVDARVLTFALLLSVLTGVIFGLFPAVQASRHSPTGALRDAGRGGTARGGLALRRTLVVGETAMALVLAIGASLLVNSFVRLRTTDPGFPTEDLVVLEMELGRAYSTDVWTPFYEQLEERVAAIPGVRAAAISAFVPFQNFSIVQSYTPEGLDIPAAESVFLPHVAVSAGFVETLGVRVMAGRDFDRADHTAVGAAVLVNEAFAREYWPGESQVVGKRIKSGSLDTEDEGWYTVVGVLSDVRHRYVADPVATVYHPVEREPARRLAVLTRVSGDPESVIAAMRDAVRQLDPALPILRVSTLDQLAASSVVQPRFYSVLAAGFGVLALVLALVGIYGTATYATGRRTREIGIRMALGAHQTSVTRMFVVEGTIQAATGVVIGCAAALALTELLESYLFGVSPTDLVTFATAAAVVAGTAAPAVWLPARRAVRTDPMTTLTDDA